MRTFIIIIMALGTTCFATAGCGKSNDTSSGAPAPSATATAVVPAATPPTPPTPGVTASAAPQAAKVELEIASVGDTMFYDKKTLTVPAGAQVHLTLKNNGKLAVMQHNWVLVKKNTEAKVALAGMEKAPDAGYVVPSDDVLAYTPLAAPQNTVEVTFTAPPPGEYPYICTFPGHYVMMKGVLTVTP